MVTSGVISSRPWMLAITKRMGFPSRGCAVREPKGAQGTTFVACAQRDQLSGSAGYSPAH